MMLNAKRDCPICQYKSVSAHRFLNSYELYFCRRCNLHFAPQAFYDKVNYNEIYQTETYQKKIIQRAKIKINPEDTVIHPTYRTFFHRIRLKGELRLLDVGCGGGSFCLAAQKMGWRVMGIDPAEIAVTTAASLGLNVRCGKLEDLSGIGELFDVVTAFEVMEHLSNPLTWLFDINKILKDDGELFCTVPNWEENDVCGSDDPDQLPPIHLLFFSVVALKKIAVKSGLFKRIDVGKIWTNPIYPLDFRVWFNRLRARVPNKPIGLWLHAIK